MVLSNPAVIGVLIVVAAFFATFGWATARDNPGPFPLGVKFALAVAIIWPAWFTVENDRAVFILASLGVFAVVHLCTNLNQRRFARTPVRVR
jgi:hypothetical protein